MKKTSFVMAMALLCVTAFTVAFASEGETPLQQANNAANRALSAKQQAEHAGGEMDDIIDNVIEDSAKLAGIKVSNLAWPAHATAQEIADVADDEEEAEEHGEMGDTVEASGTNNFNLGDGALALADVAYDLGQYALAITWYDNANVWYDFAEIFFLGASGHYQNQDDHLNDAYNTVESVRED